VGECAAADAAARREREISRLIVIDDLQQRLWEQSGLASR